MNKLMVGVVGVVLMSGVLVSTGTCENATISMSEYADLLTQAADPNVQGNFSQGVVIGVVTGIVMTDDAVCPATSIKMHNIEDALGKGMKADLAQYPADNKQVDIQRFSVLVKGLVEKLYPCK
jgi:hypothetical protein